MLGNVEGSPPDLCLAYIGVFQHMGKYECHFINSREKVRFVQGTIYNREEFLRFDSDMGLFVGFTPLWGEIGLVLEQRPGMGGAQTDWGGLVLLGHLRDLHPV